MAFVFGAVSVRPPCWVASIGEAAGVGVVKAAFGSGVVLSGVASVGGVLGDCTVNGATIVDSDGTLSDFASVGAVADVAGDGTGADPNGVFSMLTLGSNGSVV